MRLRPRATRGGIARQSKFEGEGAFDGPHADNEDVRVQNAIRGTEAGVRDRLAICRGRSGCGFVRAGSLAGRPDPRLPHFAFESFDLDEMFGIER